MAEQEAKDKKMIIREIKPKVRIIEAGEDKSKEGDVSGNLGSINEESLESLAEDAPSAREFPEFARLRAGAPEQIRQQETEIQTPAATTEAESSSRGVYQIQQNVTEKEISRMYQSRSRSFGGEEARISASLTPAPQIQDRRPSLASRDLEAARTQSEEEKYTIKIENEVPVKKKRYPWEA